MVEAAQAKSTVLSNRLEDLATRYGHTSSEERKKDIQTRFDSDSSYRDSKKSLERISKQPSAKGAKTETGALHGEMAALQLDLAELAEEYGKLNVNFQSIMNKEYSVGEAVHIWVMEILNKDKARKLKLEAATEKGDTIATLVDKMSEVLEDQYQKALECKAKSENLQVENIAIMRGLDEKIIRSLKTGYVGDADYSAAKQEVEKLELELKEFDDLLMDYESKVKEAKELRDLVEVDRLTDEMTQVLEIKYGVIDGKLSADGIVSEIRREMLDSAEAVQSAKGALSASRVNYKTISLLIDAMSELEIKYRHAKEDFIPVFKMQGNVSALGQKALAMNKALVQTAAISERLMSTNVKLVAYLGNKTLELIKTPLYDPVKAEEAYQEISGVIDELVKEKEEFIGAMQTMQNLPAEPHYTRHE